MIKTHKTSVVIAGGGPVGLFLAVCLLRQGVECTVLEKRISPVTDSRSIGIHPVSLRMLDELGLTNAFLDHGIKIETGVARNRRGELGRINFKTLKGAHKYVLICPQYHTEKILRDTLFQLNPAALVSGATFTRYRQNSDFIEIEYQKDGTLHHLQADFLAGCDGAHSSIRTLAGFEFAGKAYPDTYVMGDFEDRTELGQWAVIFLEDDGVVESFPLPGNARRWVIKTDTFQPKTSTEMLARLVNKRAGYHLEHAECFMQSSFTVQQRVAHSFRNGRILLLGDAAHVISPIGGQGMNLGWIGAFRLARQVQNYRGFEDLGQSLALWESDHKKIMRVAFRRAALNMRLGRKQRIPVFRNLLVKAMLYPALRAKSARIFSMNDLG